MGKAARVALGLLVRGTAVISCALMALFVLAMVQARLRGLVLDCGCFGALARQPISWWTVARDAALGLPGLVMVLIPARLLSLDARLLARRDAWDRRDQRKYSDAEDAFHVRTAGWTSSPSASPRSCSPGRARAIR
ncbi:MAG: MauE/DoxX family redox-associated membrane protein [Gaiellaceae bacterium]